MPQEEPRNFLSPESIGKRIARLRSERGWTQQALAARLAISRVAVSHLEMDLTIPSERTVILMAGLFKLSPSSLVEGTTYPQAKAERLPAAALSYTQLELELALLQNDLKWLGELEKDPELPQKMSAVLEAWSSRLGHLEETSLDEQERNQLGEAKNALRALNDDLNRLRQGKD